MLPEYRNITRHQEFMKDIEFDEFSYKKINTLKNFKDVFSRKSTKDVLGEFIHMQLIYKNYSDAEAKSRETPDPHSYKHAFKSYYEFANDRRGILLEILQKRGFPFSKNGELVLKSLDPVIKKFVIDQIKRNDSDPESIMKDSLSQIAKKEYSQSQFLYELLPFISRMPLFKEIMKKFEIRYKQKFFIFLGTINKFEKLPGLFIFDIDFCTASKNNKFQSESHEEFRKFHFPFWISTSIEGNIFTISLRTSTGKDEFKEINETFDINRFKNYTEVFEYTFKKIIDQKIIENLPVQK